MSERMDEEKDFALGKHLTVEYYDCNSEILADAERMEKIFLTAAEKSGAHILGSNFHDFTPQGVSGFVIIAESHFSVHAWPEHDYAAVDIFTCGESIDFQVAVETLRSMLESESMIISSVMNRGIVGNNGVERMVPVYADRTCNYALAWRTKFDSMKAWGLLCSIDIREVEIGLLHSPAAVKQAVDEFCMQLGLSGDGECTVTPFEADNKGGGLTFCRTLNNGSLVSGNVSWQNECVYLDLFSTKFFEPRIAAEQALFNFYGRHYRMQVAVRR